MLRPRYGMVRRTPSEGEIMHRCERAMYDLVSLLEEQRSRARVKVVRRILKGLGYEDRHVDQATVLLLGSGRIFPAGDSLFTTGKTV